MTASTQRMPLAEAERIAIDVFGHLYDVVERVEVAGSVRRQKEDCHDVEFVVIPMRETATTDLFGKPTSYRNLFDERCAALRESGVFADRPDKNGRPAWGTKYKRALFQGVPLDLFSATPENWGLILALRTGPAEFNLKLVQPRYKGGFLPTACRVEDGYIWCADQRIETPEEIDVFKAIGLDWTEPHDRQ